MKTIILILSFFTFITSNAQEKLFYKLAEKQSFNSVIQLKSKDKYTTELNKLVKKKNKNFLFVPIKKENNYWLYFLLDEKEIFSIKNNEMIASKSELYIYDIESKLLVSVNYDDSNRSTFEKRSNKYFCKFYLPYEDIDSIDIFNEDIDPLFSIKYTGSLVLTGEPVSHKPFCIYNHKINSFYYFENVNDKNYFELKEINNSDLYRKADLLLFNSASNNNKFNVRFSNRLLLNINSKISG